MGSFLSFGAEDHRSKVLFSSHDIKGACYWNGITVIVNCEHLDDVVSVSFPHHQVTYFSTWGFCLFYFIYWFIILYQCRLIHIYFVFWIIVQYYFIYFIAHSGLALAIGSSFHGLLCPFDNLPSLCASFFFSTSLFPGTARCSRLILHILCCSSVRISHFSISPRDSGFLYCRMVIRSQDPVARCACCY